MSAVGHKHPNGSSLIQMAVCACNRQLVALSGCLDSFVRMKVSFDQKHRQLSIDTLYNRQTTAKESAKADASFPFILRA